MPTIENQESLPRKSRSSVDPPHAALCSSGNHGRSLGSKVNPPCLPYRSHSFPGQRSAAAACTPLQATKVVCVDGILKCVSARPFWMQGSTFLKPPKAPSSDLGAAVGELWHNMTRTFCLHLETKLNALLAIQIKNNETYLRLRY